MVRATNSIMTMVNPRFVVYAVLGQFDWSNDWGIYLYASALSLVGIVIGNALAGRISQHVFDWGLIVLLLVSTLLLYATAFGITAN